MYLRYFTLQTRNLSLPNAFKSLISQLNIILKQLDNITKKKATRIERDLIFS